MISARTVMKVALACLALAGVCFILALEVWSGFRVLVFAAVLCGAVNVAVALVALATGTFEDDLHKRRPE